MESARRASLPCRLCVEKWVVDPKGTGRDVDIDRKEMKANGELDYGLCACRECLRAPIDVPRNHYPAKLYMGKGRQTCVEFFRHRRDRRGAIIRSFGARDLIKGLIHFKMLTPLNIASTTASKGSTIAETVLGVIHAVTTDMAIQNVRIHSGSINQ